MDNSLESLLSSLKKNIEQQTEYFNKVLEYVSNTQHLSTNELKSLQLQVPQPPQPVFEFAKYENFIYCNRYYGCCIGDSMDNL
jgi:hypothetical protein